MLAAELDGCADVPAALHRYAARRRVRTRQVQLMSWAASAALHLPDGPAAQRRDAGLARLTGDLAWIHGYDVLEQSAELHEAGAAVGLAANATRVLRHLGLGEDLARVSAEPTRLIHRDGRDGRTVAASRDNRW